MQDYVPVETEALAGEPGLASVQYRRLARKEAGLLSKATDLVQEIEAKKLSVRHAHRRINGTFASRNPSRISWCDHR
jgi:hypothetical protein